MSSNATVAPFILEEILRRQVRVETSAEIIAKKFFHRDTSSLRKQFDAIDTIDYTPTFDYVHELVLRQFSERADYLQKNP